MLGTGIVPPNNQGNATPFYNQADNGENPAKDGVATEAELDRYTPQIDRDARPRLSSPSPGSVTTASTPTSRRSSTC